MNTPIKANRLEKWTLHNIHIILKNFSLHKYILSDVKTQRKRLHNFVRQLLLRLHVLDNGFKYYAVYFRTHY